MANFMEELWNAIFTPGPTPPLLMATNVAFLALQAILFALLIATYSLHFVVLSVLSGGLWFSINWFAKEVMTEQAKKENEERKKASKSERSGDSAADGDLAEDEMDSEASADTEIDERPKGSHISGAAPSKSRPSDRSNVETTSAKVATGAQVRSQEGDGDGPAKQRKSMADSVGELSTDSEWEKVDDEK